MQRRILITFCLVVGVIGLLLVAQRTRKPVETVPTETRAEIDPIPAEEIPELGMPRSPWPRSETREAQPAASATTQSNLFQRIAANDLEIRLTAEQLAEYLHRNGTNVQTLLAAWQLAPGSKEQRAEYLRMAAELFPNDPRVQFSVLVHDVLPEAKREWLDRFKESAPENSLADYLSARDFLKTGDRESAFKDLAAAGAKRQFDDYTLEQWQNLEEAHMQAGKSVAEAKATAGPNLLLPHLAMLRDVGRDLQAVQKEYINAGDAASAEAVAQMGQQLGQQLSSGDGSRFLINQMVGIAIEKTALSPLSPDSQPEFLGQSVQQRLADLNSYRDTIKSLLPQWDQMMTRGNEAELISYMDRLKLQGEYHTLLWLSGRQNQ